jgi:hypothetical protein
VGPRGDLHPEGVHHGLHEVARSHHRNKDEGRSEPALSPDQGATPEVPPDMAQEDSQGSSGWFTTEKGSGLSIRYFV